MLIMTPQGLYCPAGDFYIDPSSGVDHAVITHAHSDHARGSSKQYYCTKESVSLLKVRLGDNICVAGHAYRENFRIRDVEISFYPAGHILGSAQVRLDINGQIWVASGDYKRDIDPTCAPFEPVPCDVFVTEATFGTPAYTWNKEVDHGKAIMDWWLTNSRQGCNSVLVAYSLGKAQRILGLLEPLTRDPIYCFPATEKLNECYRQENVKLAPTICMNKVDKNAKLSGELFLVPPSFLKSEQASILGPRYKTAFASGWVARSNSRYDNGFSLSDHADWHDLLHSIEQSGAKRVYTQHRGNGALIRELKSRGLKALPAKALFPKNPNQLCMF